MTVMAQHLELAPVECRLKLAQDVGSEIFGNRLHLVTIGRKHHAAMTGHIESRETMLALVETTRHPSLAADAALERDANQIAFQIIGPLVIGADEFVRVAGQLATEFCGPMRAAVFDNGYGAILGARHDHGRGPHIRSDEVARIGELRLKGHVGPGRPLKNTLYLARINRFVGVDPIWNFGEVAGPHILPFKQYRLTVALAACLPAAA